MVKLMITGRRRAGMTRAEMSRHLRHVHGPMVVAPPADAGAMPDQYEQNHVRDGVYPTSGAAAGLERDFVTEVWFGSAEAARLSVSTPYYETVLAPDEPRFVNLHTVQRCFAIESEVASVRSRGTHKAFLFWTATAGFAGAWAAAAASIAAAPSVRRWISNTTRAMPGPAPLPYDGIDEIWLDDGAEVRPLFDAMLAQLGDHVVAEACCFVVAEAFTMERLRTEL